MRVLINTVSTKKHSGGAYQIAFNFISKTLEHQEVDWIYVVSADLDEILPDAVKSKEDYYVFPTQPDFRHSYKKVKQELSELEQRLNPNVVYSITAPSYFTFKTTEVMRFTMPWVTHPNKYSWSVLSWKERMRMRLYCWNIRRLIRKGEYFITQTETTRQGIIRITGTEPQNVKVIQNVLPSVFNEMDNTLFEVDENWVDVACVANDTKHKNLDIIPSVLEELQQLGIDNVRFHLTLPEDCDSWKEIQRRLMPPGLKERAITHGRLSQRELAMMYRHCQLCFLPTLLEVFSASTLEAMFFKLPIVATDFDFNKEVMADACLYYEPMNAKDAALQIKKYIDDKNLQSEMKLLMEQRLSLFQDYDKHFNEILQFLEEVGGKKLFSK